ncbi:hypothetical protein LEP1GSC096_4524 [Leptospira interrogans serovar Hebdomadis str. R499]|nr:hypothetical protein LEP1GSC045_0057 [Leptospira interrogans serovar Pomona str. Kennewicki LC82-25]EJP02001.1 hypothetical protein LEP1GSC007_3468 [Leptospira interrogans serovar Bulgarica str. Mallika]EKN96652.1 hypothetical protein LEP1GSC014_3849 [Leptospira interrogans serovar Pomona str. Pomona]EKO68374.1 hypothetical protein LEP1GSC069_3900 [Leptospira interrogans serovar Canicola str. Fiocruz LV133]EKO97892.1 hypothetical protein LEP1GSC057_2683 [Leptospira interrogans str. Brem 329]
MVVPIFEESICKVQILTFSRKMNHGRTYIRVVEKFHSG